MCVWVEPCQWAASRYVGRRASGGAARGDVMRGKRREALERCGFAAGKKNRPAASPRTCTCKSMQNNNLPPCSLSFSHGTAHGLPADAVDHVKTLNSPSSFFFSPFLKARCHTRCTDNCFTRALDTVRANCGILIPAVMLTRRRRKRRKERGSGSQLSSYVLCIAERFDSPAVTASRGSQVSGPWLLPRLKISRRAVVFGDRDPITKPRLYRGGKYAFLPFTV